MEFIITLNKLMGLIEKGGMSSLSRIDDVDLIPQSLFISVLKNSISFYSHNELTVSRFAYIDDEDIQIAEEGNVIVQAPQLIQWSKTLPKDSKIKFKLNKFSKPKSIYFSESALDDASRKINQIGRIKLLVRSEDSTSMKWELDAFDERHVQKKNKEKGLVVLQDNFKLFAQNYSKIRFAGLKHHTEHIFDSLSLEKNENILYLVTTDNSRCACYEYGSNFEHDSFKSKILIPMGFLNSLYSIFKDSDINFIIRYSEKEDLVSFEFDDGFCFMTKTASKENYDRFPSIMGLLLAPHEELGSIDAKTIKLGIASGEIVNNYSLKVFIRSTDKNNFVVKSKSTDARKSDSVYVYTLSEKCLGDYEGVFGVNYLKDVSKLSYDRLYLSVPMNKKWLKVSPEDNKKLNYFIANLNDPAYANCTI